MVKVKNQIRCFTCIRVDSEILQSNQNDIIDDKMYDQNYT